MNSHSASSHNWPNEPLELRRLQYALGEKKSKTLKFLIWFFLIVFVLLFVLFAYQAGFWDQLGRLSKEEWVEKFKNAKTNTYATFLMFFLIVPIHYFTFRFHKHSKLVLDRMGIRYESGLPEWLDFVSPAWRIGWAEVSSVFIEPVRHFNPQGDLKLVFDTHKEVRKISLFHWVDLDDENFDLFNPFRFRVARTNQSDAANKIKLHPLYRFLQAIDKAPQMTDQAMKETLGFNLMAHPKTLTVVVLLFIAIFYSIIDFVLISEDYVGDPFWKWYLLIGFAVYILSVAWLLSDKVPKVEANALSILLGLSITVALYPATLRINQLSDTQGLMEYAYIRQSPWVYIPKDNDELPDLRLTMFVDLPEYWDRFKIRSEYRFHLRKGGLGFFQYDREPLHDAMRAYYQAEKKLKKSVDESVIK